MNFSFSLKITVVFVLSFFFASASPQAQSLLSSHQLVDMYQNQIKELPPADSFLTPSNSATPISWKLLSIQFFSGAIVGGFVSWLTYTLADITYFSFNQTDANYNNALWGAASFNFGALPWIVNSMTLLTGRLSSSYHGDFWWGLIGAYVGGGISFAIASTFIPTNLLRQSNMVFAQMVLDGVLISLGSVLFFTLFRRPFKDMVRLGSLVNIDAKGVQWGIPMPSFSKDRDGSTLIYGSLFQMDL